MTADINLGDNFEIDEDSNGDLVIRNSAGATVLRHDNADSTWHIPNGTFGSSGTPIPSAYFSALTAGTVDNGGSAVSVGDALIPDADTTHDLGSATATWNDAFVEAVKDDTGSVMLADVVAEGQVALTSNTATVDTGVSAANATFYLALGVDDPDADAKLSGTLFWDDSAGTYKVEITENIGGVDPTANYKVVRVD